MDRCRNHGLAKNKKDCVLLGENERRCFEAVWGNADWQDGMDTLLCKRNSFFEDVHHPISSKSPLTD
jgi:hypothetical protein